MSSVKAPLQKKSEKQHSSFPETELDKATIRFAGDSGDGMQLTGTRFSSTSVLAGNDVISFPDYPAEIRAPAGTLAGVSAFDLSFSSSEIYTTGLPGSTGSHESCSPESKFKGSGKRRNPHCQLRQFCRK